MILAKNHFICLFKKNILDNLIFYNYKYACMYIIIIKNLNICQ